MAWEIRAELKEMKVELPVDVIETMERAVQFLKATGHHHATAGHVVEVIIKNRLTSSGKAYAAFRKWNAL